MSSSLSPGTRLLSPTHRVGRGPDSETRVQEDMRSPRQEPQLPRRALLPSSSLSQQERRQIYFGVNEPRPLLPPGLGPTCTTVWGLSLEEPGSTCQRTVALDFTACICLLAWLFVGTCACTCMLVMYTYVCVSRCVHIGCCKYTLCPWLCNSPSHV